MFRSAPADIMKTLKEQNVTLNNHIKCIPVEVGTRQTCFYDNPVQPNHTRRLIMN